MSFNVGDKVRLVTRDDYDGLTGTVIEVDRKSQGRGYDYRVQIDDGLVPEFVSFRVPVTAHEMEKVDD